jgi:ornithine lipid ester-linked acyl 2-hydroxylase
MKTTLFNRAQIFLKDWLPRRKHPSCLQIKWAGVLRRDDDHLVAEPRDEVRFQVANQMYLWEDGKRLVFDETWSPDAWHDMNGYRVVFMSDSERPQRGRWQWLNDFTGRVFRRGVEAAA